MGELPPSVEDSNFAYARVLAEVGATLPARDAVDARILAHVRSGTGGVIEKESSLSPGERWPDYRSLPRPADRDGDGMPDFWEEQFGLNPDDAGRCGEDSGGRVFESRTLPEQHQSAWRRSACGFRRVGELTRFRFGRHDWPLADHADGQHSARITGELQFGDGGDYGVRFRIRRA